MISASQRLAVAAIDFGNCSSGSAFSIRCDLFNIHHHYWNSSQCFSNKAPTSMLFNADKCFCAFGYDAESIYSGLDEKDVDDMKKKSDYYYFQRLNDILSIKVSSLFSIMLTILLYVRFFCTVPTRHNLITKQSKKLTQDLPCVCSGSGQGLVFFLICGWAGSAGSAFGERFLH